MRAVGVLAWAALVSCGPDQDEEDPLLACLPESYREGCQVEVAVELFRTCFDGRGSCTWSEVRDQDKQEQRFEWANGASFESSFTPSAASATIHGASGERCTLSTLDDAGRCWRFGNTRRWYQYCPEVDPNTGRPIGTHYTCDDGRERTVTLEELAQAQQTSSGGPTGLPPMCMPELVSPFDDCVDAQGRRYGDQFTREPIRNCTGEACGDIASWCSDEMPCDDGLDCRNTNADPSVLFGYCTLSCEEQDCPAGTQCVRTAGQQGAGTERLCQRTCRLQRDCDPYGRRCTGATSDRDGYCL